MYSYISEAISNLYNCFCSVHCRIIEKLTLIAGRHGGIQNMEVSGLVMLRITDPAFLKILIAFDNNDNKGFQMQVVFPVYDIVFQLFIFFDIIILQLFFCINKRKWQGS